MMQETDIMNNETPDTPQTPPQRYPLPDPADLPLTQAARSLVQSTSTAEQPVDLGMMIRELRAAMAEFSPGGHFRTLDIRLAAQLAVMDSLFHIAAQNAVKTEQIIVEHGSFMKGTETVYKDGGLYLSESNTLLLLKIQAQCRRVVEGLKTGEDKVKRRRLSRRRMKMQEKNKKW
jgi:hypothetical protein